MVAGVALLGERRQQHRSLLHIKLAATLQLTPCMASQQATVNTIASTAVARHDTLRGARTRSTASSASPATATAVDTYNFVARDAHVMQSGAHASSANATHTPQ